MRVAVAGEVGERELSDQFAAGESRRFADGRQRRKRALGAEQILVRRRSIGCLAPVLDRQRAQLAVRR